ncbi:flagellar biosynthesis repressor FlbT [Prosthecodimorpha staleyi]|uniref:Flagellar biosynthesis repressor FlbT n=1 Tax=Prosthecodimorpha staleyi TaxID=2840188 RepID=A0A947D411_9HYPH|nr:flagellar biosynthesis repressor FlbT [Prosthecodimorpha staleyi]MBT9290608.1 flagellar biosynthesis repressor FlbT [Prosthecodimorpha staleyi]
MALKVELKPGERIIIGDCVITNDNQRTRLFIEGDAPILREKDVLPPKTATTGAKRIYLAIQLMYLARNHEKYWVEYQILKSEFLDAAPSALPLIQEIEKEMLTGNLYKSIKAAKALIEFEEGLLDHAQRKFGLREDSSEDGQPA